MAGAHTKDPVDDQFGDRGRDERPGSGEPTAGVDERLADDEREGDDERRDRR